MKIRHLQKVDAAPTTTQLKAPKRSIRKAAPTADNYMLISSDNFIIDTIDNQ